MGIIGNFFINVIALLAGGLLGIVLAIFQSIALVVPNSIGDAYVWLFGFVRYVNGITVGTGTVFLSQILFLILVWKIRYGINLFLHTIFPFVPVIGKKIDLPQGEHSR